MSSSTQVVFFTEGEDRSLVYILVKTSEQCYFKTD